MNILLENSILEMRERINFHNNKNSNEEAQENMWSQNLEDNFIFDDIEEYITRCRGIYWAKNLSGGKFFYAWYDEVAGQLRISAVSAMNETLPFNCKIRYMEFTDFVKSVMYRNSGLYTTTKELNVWIQEI